MPQQKKPEHPKRKLRVVAQNELSSGDKDGKPWTLYGYTVQDDAAVAIDAKFKGFNDLSESFGKVIEFGVELQQHEKYGDSFMLHPPKRDLKVAVDELRNRVSRLEHEVGELKKMIGQAPPATAAAVEPTPASSGSQSQATERPLGERPPIGGQTTKESAADTFGGDDDIPF